MKFRIGEIIEFKDRINGNNPTKYIIEQDPEDGDPVMRKLYKNGTPSTQTRKIRIWHYDKIKKIG